MQADTQHTHWFSVCVAVAAQMSGSWPPKTTCSFLVSTSQFTMSRLRRIQFHHRTRKFRVSPKRLARLICNSCVRGMKENLHPAVQWRQFLQWCHFFSTFTQHRNNKLVPITLYPQSIVYSDQQPTSGFWVHFEIVSVLKSNNPWVTLLTPLD